MKKRSKGMFRKLLVMGALAIFSMIAIAPATYSQASPILSVTPIFPLDFGNAVVPGGTKDLSFTVTNTGTGTLTGSASVSAPFSILSGSSFNLAAGATTTVTVRFSPIAIGSITRWVSFTSTGGNLDRLVSGAGVGGGVPILSVTPAFLDFSSVVVGQHSTLLFTVRNDGVGTLEGKAFFVWGGTFSVVSGSPFNLAAGASVPVTVRFSPTSDGFFGEGFTVKSNGGNISGREVFGWGVVTPVPPAPPAPVVHGCFIATAVFGTPMAEEVVVLSRFRDQYLLTNELGQRFVSLYYRHSPALAEYISNREWAKRIVRTALLPLVRIVEFIVGE